MKCLGIVSLVGVSWVGVVWVGVGGGHLGLRRGFQVIFKSYSSSVYNNMDFKITNN